jgi:hypothetical protein
MKAIAVYPGGRGVLVKVLRVSLDGTDKEAIKVYIEVAI